jgi:hypothetical protein
MGRWALLRGQALHQALQVPGAVLEDVLDGYLRSRGGCTLDELGPEPEAALQPYLGLEAVLPLLVSGVKHHRLRPQDIRRIEDPEEALTGDLPHFLVHAPGGQVHEGGMECHGGSVAQRVEEILQFRLPQGVEGLGA